MANFEKSLATERKICYNMKGANWGSEVNTPRPVKKTDKGDESVMSTDPYGRACISNDKPGRSGACRSGN